MIKRVSAVAVLLAAGAGVQGAAAEEVTWKVTAELGAVATTGNTDGTTVQGKLDARQHLEQWQNQYVFSALFKQDTITRNGEQERVRTAERYFSSVKSAYGLAREHDNLFVFASHTDDRFGSYRRYTTASVGYGRRLLNAEKAQLDVEIGPGYFRGEQVLADSELETDKGAMLRLAGSFDWQVTASADFRQTLSVESAQDNTRSTSETSLSTRINDKLRMKAGFRVTNDSEVAPGKENTDTMTYVNLVYSF